MANNFTYDSGTNTMETEAKMDWRDMQRKRRRAWTFALGADEMESCSLRHEDHEDGEEGWMTMDDAEPLEGRSEVLQGEEKLRSLYSKET